MREGPALEEMNSHTRWIRIDRRLRQFVSAIVLVSLFSPSYATTETGNLEARLRSSAAVRGLLELTVEIARRASLADPWQLRRAVETYDLTAAAEALGFSLTEAERVVSRMGVLREEILLEFPELRAIAENALAPTCAASGICDPEEAIHVMDEVAAALEGLLGGSDGYEEHSSAPSGCHWGQSIAALALCTLGGPYFYWACAYLAYCSYCSGPIPDKICF